MARYLVTGGLGFIGSHLVSELLRDAAAEVVVVDMRQQPVLPIVELLNEIQADRPGRLVPRIETLAEYHHHGRLDAIFHLASVVGPAGLLQHAGLIAESIVADACRMARLALEHRARLVHVSTSEVYGGSGLGGSGLCHEAQPLAFGSDASARQEYAAAKLAAELAIRNLCTARELDAAIARPFNVAGPRQLGGGGFVLPRLVGQALLGLPLTVFGDGCQVRAITDVRDVVAGLACIYRSGVRGNVYNVGNPAGRITIRELAHEVVRLTGSSSPIREVDPTNVYGHAYRAAPDKAPNANRLLSLGWQPRYTLRQTIEAVIDSFERLPGDLMRRVAGLADAAA